MDELAHAAAADPVEFRLRHLRDPRAIAVIQAACERAEWQRREPRPGCGRGIAFARYKNAKAYAAVCVRLEVDSESGAIRLRHVVIAADAGQIVDPSGLTNQLEGGVLQAASWTLLERVRFDRKRITSTDWETYPILKFADVPELETVLLDRPGQPYLGAGEATQGPTPAAIANAIFDATGVRLRTMPFTPERVRAACSELREAP
jgi:CO/xanthine dehydrogenase Mo-binding subunit